MTLNYQTTLLTTVEHTSIVFIGPFGNVVFFTILVILSWLLQRIMGAFPDVGSKFVLGFGVMTFLDPILIVIVDAIIGVTYNPICYSY